MYIEQDQINRNYGMFKRGIILKNRAPNKLLTMFYGFLPERQLTEFHDATTRRRRGSSQHGAQSSPEGRTNRKGVVFVSDK